MSDALLAQTGVIRVDTLEQLFDVTRVLVDQPLPAGRRVAVLSNFWGPAVLASDACLAAGLELATLDPATEAHLRPQVLEGTRLGNPFELTSDAGPRELTAAARGLLADPGVDSLLVLHAPSLDGEVAPMARALAAVAADSTKPVLASFLGSVLPGQDHGGSVPDLRLPGGRRPRPGPRRPVPGVAGPPDRARCPRCPTSTPTPPAGWWPRCWPDGATPRPATRSRWSRRSSSWSPPGCTPSARPR